MELGAPVRACVIGLGQTGVRHAQTYVQAPDAQLAAVCDVREDLARALGERLGVPFYTNAADMLSSIRPAVCSVCTAGSESAGDHHAPAVLALRMGVHVLCACPMSNSFVLGADMARTARARGALLGVDLYRRFSAGMRLAGEWLAQRRIGEVVSAHLCLSRPCPCDTSLSAVKALAPAGVDTLRVLLGEVKAVQCFACKDEAGVYRDASVHLQFVGGSTGVIALSARAGARERLRVTGTLGCLETGGGWGGAMLQQGGEPPAIAGEQAQDASEAMRARILQFIADVRHGALPQHIEGSAEQALAALKATHAAVESLSSFRIVAL